MAVDVSKLIQKAHNAIERRNYDLAIFNYIQALTFQPENIDARQKLRACQNRAFSESGTGQTGALFKSIMPFIKANILSVLKKSEESIIACENALTANPGFLPAMKLLAKTAHQLEWHEVACWQWEEILNKYDSDDVGIMYDLIDSLQEIGRADAAIELCDRIKQLSPDEDIGGLIRELAASQTAAIYRQGAEEGAHSIVKNESERRELEAESQVARSDEAREQQIAGILARFDEREDYKLLLRAADLFYAFDDFGRGYKEGKAVLDRAREMMPSDHNIKAKLGDFEIKYLKLKSRAAKQRLSKASDDADLKKAYIQSVKALRQFQIQEFEERVRSQPLISDYHQTLGKLYLESKDYEKAVAELQQSCKDPKWSIDAYTAMGQCFMGMENHDLSIDMFQRAMEGQEVFRKIQETVYFLAQALERTGNSQEALEQYTRIFEEDIMYKDVREKVDALRKKVKEEKDG